MDKTRAIISTSASVSVWGTLVGVSSLSLLISVQKKPNNNQTTKTTFIQSVLLPVFIIRSFQDVYTFAHFHLHVSTLQWFDDDDDGGVGGMYLFNDVSALTASRFYAELGSSALTASLPLGVPSHFSCLQSKIAQFWTDQSKSRMTPDFWYRRCQQWWRCKWSWHWVSGNISLYPRTLNGNLKSISRHRVTQPLWSS